MWGRTRAVSSEAFSFLLSQCFPSAIASHVTAECPSRSLVGDTRLGPGTS